MSRLICTLFACCTLTAPAAAQDVFSTYGGLSGTWAEPGLDCDQPADTWIFENDMVMAGRTRLDLLGIGGGGGAINLDLVSRNTGMRVPLSLSPRGDTLSVRGSGIVADLQRCNQQIAIPSDPITSQPLDGAPVEDLGPTTEELRQALGESRASGSEAAQTVETSVEEEVGAAAERRYSSDLIGGWRGPSGECSWRLGDDQISADGASYEVVMFSGSAERIGVQAIGPDGEPATFTVVPDGAGSIRVTGSQAEGSAPGGSLSRC